MKGAILCFSLLFFFVYLCSSPLGWLWAEGASSNSHHSKKKDLREAVGEIKEKDPRVKEQRKKIEEGQAPFPFLSLRYKGKHANYLVFYDLGGEDIYYRYRIDMFDDLAEKRLPPLTRGQAYEVKGSFLGLSLQNVFIPRDAKQFKDKLRHPRAILVFQFQSLRPLALEKLLL